MSLDPPALNLCCCCGTSFGTCCEHVPRPPICNWITADERTPFQLNVTVDAFPEVVSLVRAFHIFDNLSIFAIQVYKYKDSSHHINLVGITGPWYDFRTTTQCWPPSRTVFLQGEMGELVVNGRLIFRCLRRCRS